MNTIRIMSGTTDKLSVDDATRITSSAGQWGVRVPNLMPENLQGGSAKILASHMAVDLTTISNVYEQQTYSVSSYVENAPEDVHIRLYVWDKNWVYAATNNSATLTKGDSGELKVQVTTPKGMQSPGSLRLAFIVGQNVESDTVINYKNLMLNEGDYAPYTSSTTPYTVDELANRLEKLENKLGGVAKTLLPVLLPVRGCVA